MDIEKLKNKRQLNVQEQNAVQKEGILSEAIYWREVGVPLGLGNFLKSKGIEDSASILLNYQQNFPSMGTDWGEVLTANGKFFAFEMDLNADRSRLVELLEWTEFTDAIEISESKPGTGATWGYLALQALTELNQC